MRIQGSLVRLGGMLHRLPRMFLAGLVVFFSVVYRGTAVSVRRLFVEFRRALMKIVGHDDPIITRQTLWQKILAAGAARGCTVLNIGLTH
jgi:hypothetical protein